MPLVGLRKHWLIDKLSRYQPHDEIEAGMLLRFETFLASTEHCFSRTWEAGHITGSAWIVDASRSRVLLTHHAKLGRWFQLGGHSENDPHTLATAMREAREESGLAGIEPVSEDVFDLDVHLIPARGAELEHFHYDVRFAFVADPSEPLRVSSESRRLLWVPLHDVEALNADDSIRRMVAKTTNKRALR